MQSVQTSLNCSKAQSSILHIHGHCGSHRGTPPSSTNLPTHPLDSIVVAFIFVLTWRWLVSVVPSVTVIPLHSQACSLVLIHLFPRAHTRSTPQRCKTGCTSSNGHASCSTDRLVQISTWKLRKTPRSPCTCSSPRPEQRWPREMRESWPPWRAPRASSQPVKPAPPWPPTAPPPRPSRGARARGRPLQPRSRSQRGAGAAGAGS